MDFSDYANDSNATYDYYEWPDESYESYEIFSRTELYAITPILVFVSIFGLIGNLVVCTVIASRKTMHTTMNFYLFSLAVSDILILITNLPRTLFILWTDIYSYWFEFWYFLISETGSNASISTVTVLSVERYLAICHPFYKKCFMSNLLVVKRCLGGIWVVSIGFAAFLSIIVDTETYPVSYRRNYIIFSTSLFFVVPIILMSFFYANICWTIKKYTNDVNKKIDVNEAKAIKILVAILLLFVVCWTPFQVQRIYASQNLLGAYENMTFLIIANVLYNLSAVFNPILYSLMSGKFRREFKIVFGKCLPSNKTRREDAQSVSLSSRNTQMSVENLNDAISLH